MKDIYDDLILQIGALTHMPWQDIPYQDSCQTISALHFDEKMLPWPDDRNNGIVLKHDMTYELGNGSLPAIGMEFLTSNPQIALRDEVFLVGKDLPEITVHQPFARIVILKLKESYLQQEQWYRMKHDAENVKYRVNPHGYMPCISASRHREQIRVSKEALSQGLTFQQVGQMYLQAYHKLPFVEFATILFITDLSFPFQELEKILLRQNQITEALDHVLKDFNMDCSSCNLKTICDEVEGMKELHFQTSKQDIKE